MTSSFGSSLESPLIHKFQAVTKEKSVLSAKSMYLGLLSLLVNFYKNEKLKLLDEGSLRISICEWLGCILSISIVSVPYAFFKSGVLLGIFFNILFAYVSYASVMVYFEIQLMYGCQTIEDMGAKISSHYFLLFVQIIYFLFNVGTLIGCLVCLTDFYETISSFHPIIEVLHVRSYKYDIDPYVRRAILFFFINKIVGYKKNIWIYVTCLLLLTVCMLPNTTHCRYVFLFGFIGGLVLVITTFFLQLSMGLSPTLNMFFAIKWLPSSLSDIFEALPFFMFSFLYHTNMQTIDNNFFNPTYERLNYVAIRSFCIVVFLYTVMGISGVFLFQQETHSNILKNIVMLPDKNVLLYSTLIFFLLSQILCFTGSLESCCDFLNSILRSYVHATVMHNKLTRLVLIFFCLFVAFLLPSVKTLFKFMGSFISACIGFLFPGIFLLHFNKTTERISLQRTKKNVSLHSSKGFCLITFGLIAGCLSSCSLLTFPLHVVNKV